VATVNSGCLPCVWTPRWQHGCVIWSSCHDKLELQPAVLLLVVEWIIRWLGIQHNASASTAYHPEANGMVERAHRQLKDVLRAQLAGDKLLDHLPWELLGLWAALKDSSGISSG
jgi:hypothetical protein